jgi:hypothetical protein
MTQPSNPSGSAGKTTLDPTSISNQHLFNLHQVILKESTKRWKKIIKEGSRVSKIKEDQRKMLQECIEKVIKHLGIEQLPEMESPLVSFKDLVERFIKANTKNHQQVELLQNEKEDIQQQYRLAMTDNQRIQEKRTTIMVIEYNNLKGLRQNVEEVTKHATMLNSVVSNWPTYFATTFSKCRIQKVVVENVEKNRNMMSDVKIKEALTSQLAKEKVVESQCSQLPPNNGPLDPIVTSFSLAPSKW